MANVLDALTLKDTKTGKTTEYEIQDKGARAQIAAQVAASTDENADYAAEVVDARIGADGESYDSLGEAIRGQREKSKDEVTQLKGDLDNFYDNIYSDFRDVPVYQTANGWALKGEGHCVADSSSRLKKYAVKGGQILHLNISKDNEGVYQFQSNSAVPASETTPHLVGKPVREAVDRVVLVPAGATYLIVSESIENITNTVKKSYDSIIDKSNYNTGFVKMCETKNVILESGNFIESGNMDKKQDNVSRFRTKSMIPVEMFEGVSIEQPYTMWVYKYDANKKCIGDFGWISYLKFNELTGGAKYLNIVIKNTTNSGDISGEINDVSSAFQLRNHPTTDSLSAETFNSNIHYGAKDFEDKCKQFSLLLNELEECESFLFYTDPHLIENTYGVTNWKPKCYEFMAQIQKYYNSTPTTFALCGGDWYDADVTEDAIFKLGYIDGFTKYLFNNHYTLVGNHDTNYQGKKTSSSETYTGRLSDKTIRNMLFREEGKAYYRIGGVNTSFYCFDNGVEYQDLEHNNNYGWNQAKWFANELLVENKSHIVICSHILYNKFVDKDIHPLTDIVLKISQAYNSKTTISVDGTIYNYSETSGKVEFALFGHTHLDYNTTHYGIPCVITSWVRENNTEATFDLMCLDYDHRKVKMVRVGSGSDRIIDMA